MPVFVISRVTHDVAGTATESVVSSEGEAGVVSGDHWQRVGTAYGRADGGWNVHLSALPVHGRLVLRPPTGDDLLHATAA